MEVTDKHKLARLGGIKDLSVITDCSSTQVSPLQLPWVSVRTHEIQGTEILIEAPDEVQLHTLMKPKGALVGGRNVGCDLLRDAVPGTLSLTLSVKRTDKTL